MEILNVSKEFFYYFSGEKCLSAHSLETHIFAPIKITRLKVANCFGNRHVIFNDVVA